MGTTSGRVTLTRERVIRTAIELADSRGIEALTIRALAAELQAKPMSLYHHVAGKEAILDGLVDQVFAEIDLPPQDLPWREAMRHRCLSARRVLHQHRWAPPLMDSRANPGPATLAHHEAVLACLRRGGLDWQLVAHAYALLDAFVYGFALQEASLPFEGRAEISELADQLTSAFPEGAYPTFVEFTTQHVLQPGYSFADSFEFGLDMLLNGIEAAG